jgi:molecular chaperone DnaK (HSP70)
MWLPVGLDYGNYCCVVGIGRGSSVDIVANEQSNRQIRSMVTFGDRRRYSGDSALQQRLQYITRTASSFKQLVGLRFDSDERTAIAPHLPFGLAALPDSLTGVSIILQDSVLLLRPEQLIACLFKHLAATARAADPKATQFIISVPPWWGEIHRRTMLAAAKIAGIQCMSLLNTTTAAAIAFSQRWKERLSDRDPALIAIVDAGDSGLSAAIAKATPAKIEILSAGTVREVSGFNFTAGFADRLLNAACAQYRIRRDDLNPRAEQRFLDAVEKVKKCLAVNPVVQLECPSLIRDIDVLMSVKREDFLEIIEPFLSRIPRLFDNLFADARLSKTQITAVELLGGTSRVLSVKQAISSYFGRDISSTLDVEECFAIGCGLFGNSTAFKKTGLPLTVVDVLISPILYRIDAGAETLLFPRGTPIPLRKTVQLRVPRDAVLTFFSHNDAIGTCHVHLPGGRSSLVSLTATVNWSALFAVKVDKPATGDYSPASVPAAADLERMQKQEEAFAGADLNAARADNLRNEVEAAAFALDSAIARDFPECFAPETADQGRAIVADVQQWLADTENGSVAADEYEARLAAISDILRPARQRRDVSREVDEMCTRLIAAAEAGIRKCDGARDQAQLANAREGLVAATEELRAIEQMNRWDVPRPRLSKLEDYIRRMQEWIAQYDS